ncbi:hypothetical protein SAMN06265379_10637 [Saccharicrinis carchari]|uniref:Uncharacterized protein n=1 Tax=Saccharicrinis carchari TaxID=1168039 RepID=A0A521DMN2_SACCC|nr:hypothetical protein SAMN06265379_10637 [Saccharicrinis carchari]
MGMQNSAYFLNFKIRFIRKVILFILQDPKPVSGIPAFSF